MVVSELIELLKGMDGKLEVFSKTNRVSPIEASDVRIETLNFKNEQIAIAYQNILEDIKQFHLADTPKDEDLAMARIFIGNFEKRVKNMPKTIPQTVLVIHANFFC